MRKLIVAMIAALAVGASGLALVPAFARSDAALISRGYRPIFCWSRWLGKNGETLRGGIYYCGFGYAIWAQEKPSGRVGAQDGAVSIFFRIPFYQRFDYSLPQKANYVVRRNI